MGPYDYATFGRPAVIPSLNSGSPTIPAPSLTL